MDKLMPCPFCGSKPIIKTFRTFVEHQHNMGNKFYITCPSCYIDGPGRYMTENEAIAAWNRRADGWNKIKRRPLTTDEKEVYPEWDYIIDGELPDDGQRICVHCVYSKYESIQIDTYYDDCGMSYLGSGLELGEDVDAWMPLPEPPEEGGEIK